MLTDNINDLIPELPALRTDVDDHKKVIDDHGHGQTRNGKMINEALAGVDELKGEFEYMKTRFSPQFVQRVDKALNALSTLAYDVEVVKMTTSHAAMKKDLDVVEQRLQHYTPLPKFMELSRDCQAFAPQTEITRVEEEIAKTNQYATRLSLRTDVAEKLAKLEKELWAEMQTKMKQENFEKRFNNFELDMSEQHKQTAKDSSNLREVCDRIRRKNEENGRKIVEVAADIDLKMSSKEGLKLWSNFKKYAQYDELKDLYRKCLPAISGFEDKIKQ